MATKTFLAARMTQAPSSSRTIQLAAIGVLFIGLAELLARAPIAVLGPGLLVGLTVVLVALLPPAGLVLIALAIPLGPLVTLPLPGIGPVDVLVALTLAAWLLRGLANRSIVFRAPPLTVPLLGFVWICGLSLTQAGSWREGVPEWLKWAEFATLYLVGAQILNQRSRKVVIAALLVAGISQAVLGAYQFVGQVGPKAFILAGRFMRAYGTFQQPNPYAGYLGYLAPVAASMALAAGSRWWHSRRFSNLIGPAAYAGATAALIAGILMSWSRGAWLGLTAGLATVLLLRNRRTAAVALGGALLLLLFVALLGSGWLPNNLIARISGLGGYTVGVDLARTEITDANFSVLERLAHWQAGLHMFADHPWLGVGIGNYGLAYPAYASPHWYIPLGHAHNIFINSLAETGVLGLAAFSLFWLGTGNLAWRLSRGANHRSALALGILGTWMYLSVHSMFDNLFVQHVQLQLALLLSVVVTASPSWRDISPDSQAYN